MKTIKEHLQHWQKNFEHYNLIDIDFNTYMIMNKVVKKVNSGTLFRYTGKKKASSPDYRGKATVNGKPYQMAAWVNKSKAGQNYLRIYFFDVAKDLDPTGQNTEQGRMIIGSGVKDQAGNVDSVMLDDLPF
jgi:hypothetical protein